jgi:anti-sigma B factor antagonist
VKLEIRETRIEGVVVLEPVGRLETKTSPDLEKKIVSLLAAGDRQFVLDLAETEYVSSAGLRVFLMLAKKLAGGAGRLSLCRLNKSVREVFEIAGFASLFAIYATREAALSAPAPAPAGVAAAAPRPPAPKSAAGRPRPVAEKPDAPSLLDRIGAALGAKDGTGPASSADPAYVDRVAQAVRAGRDGVPGPSTD